MKIIINNLKELSKNFDKNNIIYYQLLLIKLYETALKFENEECSLEERQEIISILNTIIDEHALNKTISIKELNNLFEPFDGVIDIENKENYFTLFNLILQQLEYSPEDSFSFKLKQIMEEYINEILIKNKETTN